MAAENWFDRQRASLQRLQDLVRSRAARDAEIAGSFASAVDAAEKEIAKARRSIGNAKSRSLGEFESERSASIAQLQSRLSDAESAESIENQETKTRTEQQRRIEEARVKNESKERLWTVDSLHEAGDKEASERKAAQLRMAKLAGEKIDAQWDAAAVVLERVKLTHDDIEFRASRLPSPIKTDPEGKLEKCLEDSTEALTKLENSPLTKFAGALGTMLCVFASGALSFGIGLLCELSILYALLVGIGGAIALGLMLRFVFVTLARRQVRDRGTALGVFISEANRAKDSLETHAQETYKATHLALRKAHNNDRASVEEQRDRAINRNAKAALMALKTNDERHRDATEKLSAERKRSEADFESLHDVLARELASKHDKQLHTAESAYSETLAFAERMRNESWNRMAQDWHTGLVATQAELVSLKRLGEDQFPNWESHSTKLPTAIVPEGIRFGEYRIETAALPGGIPTDSRLTPSEPIALNAPAFLPFPGGCSIALQARDEGRGATVASLQSMMLHFLTGLPPGKVRFTIFDPVGLGENFAAFMHLADFDELLVTNRIWTEPSQIDARLTDLTEHMENVIQKYLRNQYESIEEYNRAAGEVAEPYRVLVIANFPTNFTPDAARRLISIMSSGPACGVCTLVGIDSAVPLPRDFRLADLAQVSMNLAWSGGKFHLTDPALAPFPLTLDRPPDSAEIVKIVRKIGEASRNAARVEVPFEFIAPAPDQVWLASAAGGFSIPIGRSGATKRQILALGKGTAQHALIAGKTGSGKSTLLHALITNLALTYRPEEAELYLIDFKKGVEFKIYAEMHLPHARVIAIESEREFGLSVLQRLDAILRERGDLFRTLGVNDFPSFRELNRPEPLPRILLVVDEFQEFFIEDDKLSQEAGLLIDRLVRQGRAFGVHVILGSQTLGGGYSLPRTTIDQMAVRIALQSSEADAQLILSKDNSAARLLTRPGEAIYNDANGLTEGNNPFQVVWLSEERREAILAELQNRSTTAPRTLVFEGSAAAELSDNALLQRTLLECSTGPATLWLGDAIAIKDPTAAIFRPQSGANLLLIGQSEESALAIATAGLLAFAARFRRPDFATVIDGTPDDSEFADTLRGVVRSLRLNPPVERSELPAAIGNIARMIDDRSNARSADRSPHFLFIHGLHRLRELRKAEEDFGYGRRGDKAVSAGDSFSTILREGPAVGIHVITWCDSVLNLTRAVERQGMREFTLRVLFQMSANDSAQLIDTPAASRLGRSRALYIEDGVERPEKFRAYALPTMDWLNTTGSALAKSYPPISTEPEAVEEPIPTNENSLITAAD